MSSAFAYPVGRTMDGGRWWWSRLELLRRLSFISGPVESLYLNEIGAHENFIGQLGRSNPLREKWRKKADAKGGLPFINLGHLEILEESGPGLYKELEAERAAKEGVSQIIEGADSHLWLLTIDDGTSVCAATLDNRWLRPAFRHWVEADSDWEVSGILRQPAAA